MTTLPRCAFGSLTMPTAIAPYEATFEQDPATQHYKITELKKVVLASTAGLVTPCAATPNADTDGHCNAHAGAIGSGRQ